MSKKKKKHTGLKVTLGILSVAVLAAAGLAGYYTWQKAKLSQEASRKAAQLEESYQQEVSSMQGVYKQWSDVVNVDTIYDGVSAMGVSLSGMTEEEATEALNEYYSDAVLEKKITLKTEGQDWSFTYADLGFTANTAEVAASAYGVCREGSLRQRYDRIMALASDPVELILSEEYNASKIDEILAKIDEEVTKEAKDATVTKEGDKFVTTKEVPGQKLDIEAMKETLTEKIKGQEDIELELAIEEVEPEIKEEDLKDFGAVIGTFNTYYDLANTPRNTNLEVGCSHISGLWMQPGDSFNFNDTVSPVDTASGYMEASTISNGQYVPGLGGGLCQVCTTLYNAVIRAELDVTERYSHSLEPGYVPNGQDAAMSIGGKNFQFVNTSKYPIYIEMSAYGGTLNCTIYGVEEHDPSRTVSFESYQVGTIAKPSPIYTKDDSLYEDEQKVTSYGREGLQYDVYKIVTENGKTTSEYFNSSTYSAVADRITIGTKKRPQQDTASSETSEENAGE